MKIIIRWLLIVQFVVVILITGTVYISGLFPQEIGTMVGRGYTINRISEAEVFIDLDTGLTYASDMPVTRYQWDSLGRVISTTQRCIESQCILFHLQEATDRGVNIIRDDGTGAVTVGEYPDINGIEMIPDVQDDRQIVIHSDDDGTIIYYVNEYTGELTEGLTLPDFKTRFTRFSPNQRYVLLRADDGGTYRMVMDFHPLYLVDLVTNRTVDLDSPAFAYWSPDSEKLALGRDAGESFQLNVEIYHVADDRTQALLSEVPHEDAPFFDDRTDETAVLWSPDSEALALADDDHDLLALERLTGERYVIDGVTLSPELWSPNGQYLYAFGFDQTNSVGGYIVDFEQNRVEQLQSVDHIRNRRSDMHWAENSQYIVWINQSLQSTTLSVFDRRGHLVRQPVDIFAEHDIRPFMRPMRWANI